MSRPIFGKTIFISLLSHLAAFSIFSLSFGNIINRVEYPSVAFWGQLLPGFQVKSPIEKYADLKKYSFNSTDLINIGQSNKDLIKKNDISKLYETNLLAQPTYFKPHLYVSLNTKKALFNGQLNLAVMPPKRKESVITFHPLLPYGFPLYFKDRQIAHVELMFNIESRNRRNSINIKRKISSGNLEVDLLSMRYIGHYLFIQQLGFAPDSWHTVKIDLSENK